MGRRLNPIQDPGPIGKFAQRLRDRREQAGTPPFRQMAKATFCSHAVLADACAGKTLPTWEVTEAFVRALGADDDEVERWKTDRLQPQKAVGRLRRQLGDADVVVPTHTDTGRPIRPGRLRPVQPDLADPTACVPRPDAAHTFDDLLYQVRVLQIAVGSPSLRDLHKHLKLTQGQYIGVSTLGDLLSGRRTPSSNNFEVVVQGLLNHLKDEQRAAPPPWGSVQVWLDAWTRAEFNRIRPDLSKRTANSNIYLMTSDQDPGPAPGLIGDLAPRVAAALLTDLSPPVRAGIISALSPDKAQAIITEMWNLTGAVQVDAETGTTEGTVLHLRPKNTDEGA
jgi:hypothetical protein